MFVGVHSITIPKKFDVKQAIEDSAPQIAEAYNQVVEHYEGRR